MSQVKEKDEATASPNRREFLRNFIGLTGIAVVAAAPVARKISSASTNTSGHTINVEALSVTAVDGDQDPIERMRADMASAMQKPVAERRWVMVIALQMLLEQAQEMTLEE